MRPPHFLSKPQKTRLPIFTCYFDVETRTVEHGNDHLGRKVTEEVFTTGVAAFQMRRGDRWSDPEWLDFDGSSGITTFWAWVTGHVYDRTRLDLYAHNVSFDMSVCRGFEELPKLGYHLTNFIVDDPPTLFEWSYCSTGCFGIEGSDPKECHNRKNHRRIRILDTMNYFGKISLKVLGDSVGTPKFEMPAFEDGSRKPYEDPYLEEWRRYNRQDVQVMIDAMHRYMDFLVDHDLGSMAITQASQSFTAFRHRFMDEGSIFIDSNPRALEISRRAYYGGRTEAFRMIEDNPTGETFYKLDINSMYPAVMHEGRFPTKLKAVWRNVVLEEFETLKGRDLLYCAEVYVRTDEPAYPVYMDDRLVFPVGEFRAFLSTPEILYGIERGHILGFRQLAIYDSAPLFREYVDYFYRLRLKARTEDDETQAFFLKIMMNSLYGKFGQNGRKWKTIGNDGTINDSGTWIVHDADTNENVSYRKAGGVVQQLQQEGESMNSHPAIAAHITAQARINLWSLIVSAGRDHVFYCDTDSLIVDSVGRDRLTEHIDPARLGALKVEGESAHLVVRGLKHYEFGAERHIKGVGKAPEISPNVFRVQMFHGLKGKLRTNDLNSQKIYEYDKHLSLRYSKGEVGPDGWISPFVLSSAT